MFVSAILRICDPPFSRRSQLIFSFLPFPPSSHPLFSPLQLYPSSSLPLHCSRLSRFFLSFVFLFSILFSFLASIFLFLVFLFLFLIVVFLSSPFIFLPLVLFSCLRSFIFLFLISSIFLFLLLLFHLTHHLLLHLQNARGLVTRPGSRCRAGLDGLSHLQSHSETTWPITSSESG